MHPIALAVQKQRGCECRSDADGKTVSPCTGILVCSSAKVMDMHRFPVDNRPAVRRAAVERSAHTNRRHGWYRAEMRHGVVTIAFQAANQSIVGLTQPRCTLGNGIHHRLDVRRYSGDHPQDVAGGGLLLQSVREFALKSLSRADLFGLGLLCQDRARLGRGQPPNFFLNRCHKSFGFNAKDYSPQRRGVRREVFQDNLIS